MTGPAFCELVEKVNKRVKDKLLPEDIDNTTDLGYWMEMFEYEMEELLDEENR